MSTNSSGAAGGARSSALRHLLLASHCLSQSELRGLSDEKIDTILDAKQKDEAPPANKAPVKAGSGAPRQKTVSSKAAANAPPSLKASQTKGTSRDNPAKSSKSKGMTPSKVVFKASKAKEDEKATVDNMKDIASTLPNEMNSTSESKGKHFSMPPASKGLHNTTGTKKQTNSSPPNATLHNPPKENLESTANKTSTSDGSDHEPTEVNQAEETLVDAKNPSKQTGPPSKEPLTPAKEMKEKSRDLADQDIDGKTCGQVVRDSGMPTKREIEADDGSIPKNIPLVDQKTSESSPQRVPPPAASLKPALLQTGTTLHDNSQTLALRRKNTSKKRKLDSTPNANAANASGLPEEIESGGQSSSTKAPVVLNAEEPPPTLPKESPNTVDATSSIGVGDIASKTSSTETVPKRKRGRPKNESKSEKSIQRADRVPTENRSGQAVGNLSRRNNRMVAANGERATENNPPHATNAPQTQTVVESKTESIVDTGIKLGEGWRKISKWSMETTKPKVFVVVPMASNDARDDGKGASTTARVSDVVPQAPQSNTPTAERSNDKLPTTDFATHSSGKNLYNDSANVDTTSIKTTTESSQVVAKVSQSPTASKKSTSSDQHSTAPPVDMNDNWTIPKKPRAPGAEPPPKLPENRRRRFQDRSLPPSKRPTRNVTLHVNEEEEEENSFQQASKMPEKRIRPGRDVVKNDKSKPPVPSSKVDSEAPPKRTKRTTAETKRPKPPQPPTVAQVPESAMTARNTTTNNDDDQEDNDAEWAMAPVKPLLHALPTYKLTMYSADVRQTMRAENLASLAHSAALLQAGIRDFTALMQTNPVDAKMEI
ncbi:Aste57867_18389 [Aphanomyces stellatus]|uniref:Aste57867_18389 protein n=1 Tax=Aphanomyces stellatus TaxID=120398 RepID=A0A485LAJ8_9STRA|nr:hypothetical protein As57867_018327 [Aphanomyces stellatus]VFT95125.1 Aste57867_18389 [Aphanomyces stellatus]